MPRQDSKAFTCKKIDMQEEFTGVVTWVELLWRR